MLYDARQPTSSIATACQERLHQATSSHTRTRLLRPTDTGSLQPAIGLCPAVHTPPMPSPHVPSSPCSACHPREEASFSPIKEHKKGKPKVGGWKVQKAKRISKFEWPFSVLKGGSRLLFPGEEEKVKKEGEGKGRRKSGVVVSLFWVA